MQVHRGLGTSGGAGATDDDLLLALLDGSDASIGRLLRLIRSHGNTRAAISAAVAAVQALPCERGSDASGSGRTSPTSRREKKELKEEGEPVPDPATYLNSYPRCKQLINAFRLNSNTHNKTPLAILHEYATRLNLEASREGAARRWKGGRHQTAGGDHTKPTHPAPAGRGVLAYSNTCTPTQATLTASLCALHRSCTPSRQRATWAPSTWRPS